MPIYEYQCNACGHTLEALQKISEPVLTECPACNKAALQKLVSSTSFQLKGTGWYETDFKTKKATETKATDTGKAGESSGTSTDTTTPTKTNTDKT